MRFQRTSVDDAIPGVPTASYARAIKQHRDSRPNSSIRLLGWVAGGELLQGDDGESRRNYPAIRAGHPGPALFGGVDTCLSVGRLELPAPQPVCLATLRVEQPCCCLLTHSRIATNAAQRYRGQSCRPRSVVVSFKGGPRTIPALSAK